MHLTPYAREPKLRQVYLWLRYMPIAYLMAVIALSIWVLRGAPTMTVPPEAKGWPGRVRRANFGRLATARCAWNSWIGLAHIKMGRYLTLPQMMENLRERTT